MSCTDGRAETAPAPKAGPGLVEAWESAAAEFRGAYAMRAAALWAGMRRGMLEMFAREAAAGARLNDEAVHARLLELMGVYRKIVLECRVGVRLGAHAKALLDGVCEVLVSRYSQFFAGSPRGPGSPVRAEKIGIMEAALLGLAERADALMAGSFGSPPPPAERFEFALPAGFADGARALYECELAACLAKLDDLHARKAAGFYADVLEREWEELGNLIKVQAGPLEESGPPGEGGAEAVARALSMLREVYQHLGPVVEDCRRAPRRDGRREDAGDFWAAFAAPPAFALAFDMAGFAGLLGERARRRLRGMAALFAKAGYRMKRMAAADALLAKEVCGVFSGLLGSLACGEGQGRAGAILAGIRETVEIKLLALTEARREFEDRAAALIGELGERAQSFAVPEAVAEEVSARVLASWLAGQVDDEAKFLDDCFAGEEFQPARECAEKLIEARQQAAEKCMLEFRRDALLYELCTFEEILTHSVPKLDEGGCREAALAAARLRGVFGEIEVILRKNGISAIRPNVGDEFLAREHEVLVAEKSPGFAKGQIVKVLTAGYQHRGAVLIRAHVVCAR